MKQIPILAKMMIGISIPVILALVIAGCIISSKVGDIVITQAKETLASDSLAAANQVSDFFMVYLSGSKQAASNYQIESILRNTKASMRMPDSEEYPTVKITLDKLAATDKENILASWIGDFDASELTQSDNYTSPAGWDITARPWYRVKETRDSVLTEPYIDASTGELIISAASPVIDHTTNEVLGASGYDIKLSHLSSIMDTYKIGENGFIVLFTNDGLIVYHPNSEKIQQNISELNCSEELKAAVLNGTSGNLDYMIDHMEYSGAVEQVGNTGWMVLTGMPHTEMLSSYYSVIRIIVGIFAAALILLALIIFAISRNISKPIRKLSVIADQIAGGKLDVLVDVKSNDETGLVAQALQKTVHRLKSYIDYINEISAVLYQISENDLVFELSYDYAGEFSKIKDALMKIRSTLTTTIERISQTANEVSAGSEQVSAGAQALSQGTMEQASAVEQLASTIGEISEQVKENARGAMDANKKVNQVTESLSESSRKMEDLTLAMDEIHSRSGEIEKIVKTIDDIAFQTNILALNAAVEAARAGSSGKGFAVVADEVRSLAVKSQEAAKNTTQLIGDSLAAINRGNLLAGKTTESILRIADEAKITAKTIQNISQASISQADAIEQVTQGMEQISSVVQTNSATSEESAAASEELSGQAQRLKNLVLQFHLDKN